MVECAMITIESTKTKNKFARGMRLENIPVDVKLALNDTLLSVLCNDGHGITFPCDGLCQVRIKRNGRTHSKSFAFSKYGGIVSAIKSAMQWTIHMRKMYVEINQHSAAHRGYSNILLSKRPNVRSKCKADEFEYFHSVYYNDPISGLKRHKIFWHGYTYPTAGQWLHAQNTALHFRDYVNYCDELGVSVNCKRYAGWKNKRLYRLDNEACDYNVM